jgi:hypothetical protein
MEQNKLFNVKKTNTFLRQHRTLVLICHTAAVPEPVVLVLVE